MKRIINITLILLVLTAPLFIINTKAEQIVSEEIATQKVEILTENKDFTSTEILVKYKKGKNGKDNKGGFQLIKLGKKDKVKNKLKDLLKRSDVESAQPNYIYKADSWTVDSTTAKPGDYNNTNHWYYTKGKVPEMWKAQNCAVGGGCGGENTVTVAVIDTGLAFEAFDDTGGMTNAVFAPSAEYSGLNFFINSGEVADDGLDNDCNGYVDDVNGIDAYTGVLLGHNTCTAGVPDAVAANFKKAGHPNDTYGHGSLVTGTIASAVDNSDGSVSPGFDLQIMPLAASVHFSRSFTTAALIDAVDYAKDNGADVINMSLGGTGFDSAFKASLDSAAASGVILVAASGNTGSGIVETSTVYPAAYSSVLSVGAINSDDTRSYYSVYGAGVDVVAYVGDGGIAGDAVWQNTVDCYSSCNSTTIDDGNEERFAIGTSFASPQVAGLLALIKLAYPSLTPTQVQNQLINSATDVSTAGYDIKTGWGVINFYKAITTLNSSTPVINTPVPVHRFLQKDLKVHFYTASSSEKNNVQDNLSDSWDYEGIGFYTYNKSVSGNKPVFRFLHKQLFIHFYTASTSERDSVIDNLGGIWEYEGIGYYTYNGANKRSLYRFLHNSLKVHFYTASESEKTNVQNNLSSTWTYEGVAYTVK